eukprot:CAMPEP_0180674876 /NCGR_PEP_ID=MMETSP1037_2-20121125/66464_1 /TAXON_ID=632150 /ORGANISM="Azadinium spinosum, Strain 3D9" /LENGTH=264 /DNA_ID=CAMNT_0022704245 /DNA_START=86 /DNA_END=877 /DNA_ORIENTATION=+
MSTCASKREGHCRKEMQYSTCFTGVDASTASSDTSSQKKPSRVECLPLQRISRKGLRTQIQMQKMQMRMDSSSSNWNGCQDALDVIEEMPELVLDALQRSTDTLIDQVQGEITVMGDMIRYNQPNDIGTRSELAIENLNVIPDIMKDSFEASFARAKDTVRCRVDHVIQGIVGIEEKDLGSKSVVEFMRVLPGEVAMQNSKVQAQQQFDTALQALPEESAALREAKLQIVANDPNIIPDTLLAARNVAEGTVEQAVLVVKDAEQ